ncbi:TPR-like protein [Mycena galericulata]|nr:TPR-like protein [Mycena galericulata]
MSNCRVGNDNVAVRQLFHCVIEEKSFYLGPNQQDGEALACMRDVLQVTATYHRSEVDRRSCQEEDGRAGNDDTRHCHAFKARCSHIGAVWTSGIYKIDFLPAFKLLDLSLATMSFKLKTVIQLQSICVTSLNNPHDDLPGDMKMFAHLIIKENIFLQTLPVASEHDQMSWKLDFRCNIPPDAPTFSITVLRQSKTEGTRLVGFVKIKPGEVLASVELKRSFQLQLNKVNPDGPSLNFQAVFSASELPYQEVVYGVDLIGMPEYTIVSVKGQGIGRELQKMYEDSKKTQFSINVLQLWTMHERMLLCCQSNGNRARWLNMLGHLFLQSYQASGSMDDLSQAVCSYNDAVRDDPGPAIFLADLGKSLGQRFQQCGRLQDIDRSVVMLKTAVEHTLLGDPRKQSSLGDLGHSLLLRFGRVGGIDDLNQSVLRHEAAIALTPDGHPNMPVQLYNLGNSLLHRFERLGGLDDLNQSVSRLEAAIALTPNGHLNMPSHLYILGSSLFHRFACTGALDDLNQSILRFETAVALTLDGYLYKPSLLNKLGTCLIHRFERLGGIDDLNQSVLRLEAAVALTPDGPPDKCSWLNDLGTSLLLRFKRFGGLDDLNQSILRYETAISLTPDGQPNMPSQLSNLGDTLHLRFKRLGGLDDLNQSILRYKTAISLTPDGHPNMPSRLSNLGDTLHLRFKRLGNLDDLNQSVLRYEAAIALTPDGHLEKPSVLSSLGSSLLDRFEQLGDLDDLNQSVSRSKDAIALTLDGHPGIASRLSTLANSLLCRFERLGDLDDLNQSVLRSEAAIALTPDGHPDKAAWFNNLGNSLLFRFEQLGVLEDLNQSVLRYEAAVSLTPDSHSEKAKQLSNLGNSLLHRFQRLGGLDNLNRSVSRLEAAVALTADGHPGKPSLLNNLGNSLSHRFKQLGRLDDLNQSVLRFEAAVALTLDGHLEKPTGLSNLGNSLLCRFERLGGLDDLNQAVLRLEAAVALTPNGHPHMPRWLGNLGNSLLHRFMRLGSLDDLNHSVLRMEAAVALTPEGNPDQPLRLNNLGISLLHRFERLGGLDDLNQSVLTFEAAVALTPNGHLHEPTHLANLGNSLLQRFKRLGGLDDLNQSVLRFETAIALTLDDHLDKPSQLNNLGTSLLHRFELLGCLDDLNQSVSKFESAVALTPDGHPDKPLQLSNLGDSLHQRFEQLHDPHDSQQLLCHYIVAASAAAGPATVRFNAARMWAKHAHIHQPSSILNAYTTAIELLPELAWLGLSITDRHYRLSQAGQVVRDAASAAIAVHDYQKAVEWLEQGRSIIWGQLLNLRTPVDELRKSHPSLADQLVSFSTSLEAAGTHINAVADAIQAQSLRSVAQQSHALALQRDRVLQKIRELPEFERFLLPRPISELSLAAKMGPVAIVNISEFRCDALLLMPGMEDEVIHVPLHDFTAQVAQSLAESLASIVGTPGRSDRLNGCREGYIVPDDRFSHILSELWVKIVRPVLNALAIMTRTSQDLGRIWWCPTGPLAFLPIHAAGLYGEDEAFGSKLSDFLISSYTPSLTALIQGYRQQSESEVGLQLLAITQPSADGQSYIPGTQEEIQCIKQHAKGKVPVLWLDNEMATIEKAQKGMKDSKWVHFACHGVQSSSPTESALLLAGSSRLMLSNIIQLSLPNADLAFLSACQTATGSEELQDESVHLAAGMLLAGYRGVIGTMWSIMDNDAPQVASDVYAHLLEVSPPDPTRAAEALHLAIQKLRVVPGGRKSFLHWVPFIHFGV